MCVMVMGPRGLGGAGFYPSKQVLQPLIEGLTRFWGFIENLKHRIYGVETADGRRWTLMNTDRVNFNQDTLLILLIFICVHLCPFAGKIQNSQSGHLRYASIVVRNPS